MLITLRRSIIREYFSEVPPVVLGQADEVGYPTPVVFTRVKELGAGCLVKNVPDVGNADVIKSRRYILILFKAKNTLLFANINTVTICKYAVIIYATYTECSHQTVIEVIKNLKSVLVEIPEFSDRNRIRSGRSDSLQEGRLVCTTEHVTEEVS